MKIYILGKLGKLTHEEWLNRRNTASYAILTSMDTPLNFADEATLHFEDTTLQLINEMSYLLQADSVWLLADFNECEDARLLLIMAVRMNLPIMPAKNCILPARISFTLNL